MNVNHKIINPEKDAKPVSKIRYYASLLEAIILFIVSVYITHYASLYAEVKASGSVDDIILSNTRVYNFEIFFVYIAIMLGLFVITLCLRFTKTAPFLIKTVSLFIIIRSAFVSLTHIGPYPTKLILESRALDFVTSGNDLFFSGHTGLPFLIALIFWDHLYIRILFLTASIVLGSTALLAHLHYSIDVFAAFFITYTIYHISVKIFKKDFDFFTLEDVKHK